MALKNLAIGVCCLVLFGGSFAAGVVILRSKNRAQTDLPSAGPANLGNEVVDHANGDEGNALPDETSPKTTTAAAKTSKGAAPAAKSNPRRPLTCMEATKLGADCVGKRVTWVGKWTHSQSTTINRQEASQHIFYTPDAGGTFTFDYPFIAEDPKPLGHAQKGENIKEYFNRKWGSSGIVTVTGTIARVETLIFIGRGTRYDVPVLTDIQIKINP
jgi:hypothetical protein